MNTYICTCIGICTEIYTCCSREPSWARQMRAETRRERTDELPARRTAIQTCIYTQICKYIYIWAHIKLLVSAPSLVFGTLADLVESTMLQKIYTEGTSIIVGSLVASLVA